MAGTFIRSLAPLLLAATPLVTAQAAEVKISGVNTFIVVSEQSRTLEDGRSITHLHQKGITREDDSENPFHHGAIDCFGTVLVAADGQSFDAGGSCAVTDMDGDTWWVAWSGGPEGGPWNAMRGTGKFEGISGGGTWVNELTLASGQSIDVISGTLTLK